jgi:metal-dependent hydrolase (beta-lactamase superfamily II)
MKAVVLIDNNPDPDGKYLTEHGVSIYFEADGLKWLFDVGASPSFAINARKMPQPNNQISSRGLR